MSAFVYILAFTVGFLLVQLAIHLAWKRRRAKAPIVSPTVESMGKHMKALYSSAALEEMAKQENPLFEMARRHEEATVASAESRAKYLFALGSVKTGTPLKTHAASSPTAEEREQFAHTMETVPLDPTGIVFKPGKPLNPVPDMLKEPDIEQVSRIMHLEGVASDLRMRNRLLECEVSRLEGVIEGMGMGMGKPVPADEPKDESP